MDIIELKKISDASVFTAAVCLECGMEVMLKEARGVDNVMQDHWLYALGCSRLREDSSTTECLQLIQKAEKAINEYVVQMTSANQHFSRDETEAPLIAEMLIGSIGHAVDDNLAECSRKVKEAADRVLTKKKRKVSDAECEKMLSEFMDSIIPMVREYGYELVDYERLLDVNGLYLESWFWDKCKTKKRG